MGKLFYSIIMNINFINKIRIIVLCNNALKTNCCMVDIKSRTMKILREEIHSYHIWTIFHILKQQGIFLCVSS